jgi:hypothetical protein
MSCCKFYLNQTSGRRTEQDLSVRCDLLTAATLHSIDCRLCQAPCGFLELYFPPFLSVISGGTVAIQIGNECDI